MTIEVEDYRIEQNPISPERFDLVWTKDTDKSKPGAKSERREVYIGYGMPINRILRKMAYNNLAIKKDVVTFEKFVKLWNEEVRKIEKLLNNVM